MQTQPILVAIPTNWRNDFEMVLTKANYQIEMALSKDELLHLLDSRQWGGLVIVADWVIDESDAQSLIEKIEGKIPTLTIITQDAVKKFGFGQLIDKVYKAAMHQFCTTPVDSEELVGRLQRAVAAFNQH